MSSSSSCGPAPVALGPLEATGTFSTSSPTPSLPPRFRRTRRVLYPASRSRRPRLREAPDRARRWLLLLSALVFLQIYTEDTNPCTELQSQCPDLAVCPPQEGEEPHRVQTVAAGSEAQLECVVA